LRTLLPISEEQFNGGIKKHLTMVARSMNPEELMLSLPYHRILAEHARARKCPGLALRMIDTFWDKHEELTYGGNK